MNNNDSLQQEVDMHHMYCLQATDDDEDGAGQAVMPIASLAAAALASLLLL